MAMNEDVDYLIEENPIIVSVLRKTLNQWKTNIDMKCAACNAYCEKCRLYLVKKELEEMLK